MITYYFLTEYNMRLYKDPVRPIFSAVQGINLRWVNWLVKGHFVFILLTLVMFGCIYDYPARLDFLLLIGLAIGTPYSLIIAFKGIIQPMISLGNETQPEAKTVKETKTERPAITDERFDEMISQITAAMEKDKLYRDTELTLQELADHLDQPSYLVSQAINDGMNKNFYDLVNSYRVEEAKRLLIDARSMNYTILSVGYEAGFNSKTTFNTVFKKFTGYTPTAFRNKKALKAIA
jgi:AraC-like DNA-binding protein